MDTTNSGASAQIFSANIETARKLIDIMVEFIVKYSFQLLGGIIVIVVGFVIAKIAGRFLASFLTKYKVDITVTKFLVQTFKILILTLAGLIALGNFGITIAPFIAGLSVAGFGLSFALQGPLSNYAAGATLIFTKPFKVGEIIEVTGVIGEVEDMSLARTKIRTVDGTDIVIPNKQVIGEIIHNYSSFKKVDIKVGVAYGADIEKAVSLLKRIVSGDKRISNKPEPKVGISEFGDSGVNLYARVWCKQSDYWDVLFDINRMTFAEFNKNSITIPFPQREVRILK